MDIIKSNIHIKELDGIRGLAILMVLIWHYFTCQIGAEPISSNLISILHRSSQLMWSGVDLFFVLSGFLIGGILIDNFGKRSFLKTFYIRRAARILPVYGMLLLSYFLLRSLLSIERYEWLFADSMPDYSYITFTQNIYMGIRESMGCHFLGVTWSLAVEEQFYLFLPLIMTFFSKKNFAILAITLIILTPLWRFLMTNDLFLFVNMPFRVDSLLMGVLLAIAFRSARIVSYLFSRRILLWIIFIVLFVVMCRMTIHISGRGAFEPTLIAFFYSTLMMLSLIYKGSTITCFLRSRFLTYLGLYSYGIYMYHQMISGLLHGYLTGLAPNLNSYTAILITLISLCLTFSISILSYEKIESIFLKMGRKVKY